MDFKTYQKKARETAQYPNLGSNNIYPTLGLVGEAGEVAEKVKKVIRDKNGIFDNESKLAIKKELGDVLWYLSNLSTEFGFELDDVASENLAKLKNRSDRNKIFGSGDDRWNISNQYWQNSLQPLPKYLLLHLKVKRPKLMRYQNHL